ncbi:MAG TPA: hypothetical protein VGB76_22875 [Pyrinomonadaceae bacterium]
MQRRQITLEDGRYLVFYTFDEMKTTEAPAAATSATTGDAPDASRPDAEPSPVPQATEEPRV